VTVTPVDAVFEDRSIAVNECAPAVDGGSVNEQEKLPTELVVWVHAVPAAQVTVTRELAA